MSLNAKELLDISVEKEDDGEYQRQLVLFARSSTEKEIELVKLGEIIGGLSLRLYFLDIGAGGGGLNYSHLAIIQRNNGGRAQCEAGKLS